jgi:hypothetical protein
LILKLLCDPRGYHNIGEEQALVREKIPGEIKHMASGYYGIRHVITSDLNITVLIANNIHISSAAILYKNCNLCALCHKFLNMLFKVWGNSKKKAVVADSLTDLLKKGTLCN